MAVVAQEIELFGQVFPRPAAQFDALFPGGHGRRLHHRVEARRGSIHAPIGLLLALHDDLLDLLPVAVHAELFFRLHLHKVPLPVQDLLEVVERLALVVLESVPLAVSGPAALRQVNGVLDVVRRVMLRGPIIRGLESVQRTVVFDDEVLEVVDREVVAELAQQIGEMDGFQRVFDAQAVHKPLDEVVACVQRHMHNTFR